MCIHVYSHYSLVPRCPALKGTTLRGLVAGHKNSPSINQWYGVCDSLSLLIQDQMNISQTSEELIPNGGNGDHPGNVSCRLYQQIRKYM